MAINGSYKKMVDFDGHMNGGAISEQHCDKAQGIKDDLAREFQITKIPQESKEQYSTLLSEMCNGIALHELIFDKSGKPCNCRFLKVNPAFEQIVKLRNEEIIKKTIDEVFPGTKSFWVDQCGKAALIGKPVHFKNSSKLYDRYFEVSAYSPQKPHVVTVFTDITDRMQMEWTLRESETNFRSLAENSSDGILIVTGSGKHAYANSAASEITGYSVDALKNMAIQDLISGDELIRISQMIRFKNNSKRADSCFETIFITKEGKQVPVEASSSNTFWKSQPAVIVSLRNIFQRKRFEEALSRMNNELELRVLERTNELTNIAEELEQQQKELLKHKLDLEKSNRELAQTNTALTVLARNINKKRDEVERKIAQSVSSQILPVIDEIQTDKIPEKSRAKLEVLTAYLNDLTPNASKGHEVIVSLSSMELRVAMMIKNGFSSDEIARLLHISIYTVKTHRRSIRKKLKIKNTNINLASYLKLKLGKVTNGSTLSVL